MDDALRDDPMAGFQPGGDAWDPLRPDIWQLLETSEHGATQPIYYGSNHTFLVTMRSEDAGESYAVYKPARGEYPLYDFPQGTLYRREIASCLLDRILHWTLVPPTVETRGRFGVGSLQLFIEAVQEHEIPLAELRRLALLDVLLNNADRKAEHCLVTESGKLWGIDHGLSFHAQPKLRTVLWHFAGSRLAVEDRADVARALDELETGSSQDAQELRRLLSTIEWRSLHSRLQRTVDSNHFPDPRNKSVPYRW